MKYAALPIGLLTVFLVAGCSSDNEAERVYTVEEYTEDLSMAEEVVERCRNNPGQLQDDPNCINASEAVARHRLFGSGEGAQMPSITGD